MQQPFEAIAAWYDGGPTPVVPVWCGIAGIAPAGKSSSTTRPRLSMRERAADRLGDGHVLAEGAV